jgi:hypothetical protein
MAVFTSKVLWVVNMADSAAESRLLEHAKTAGIGTVCIRSTNQRLADAIGRFHAKDIKVYAWRWPAVQASTAPHHFAPDEADFVVNTLIPAGLDGYMVDPESDPHRAVDDWNDTSLAPLAKAFCVRIKDGAAASGRANFRFGTTSGCSYPNPNNRPDIPWSEFAAASDVLLPQSYWRVATDNGPSPANGATPKKAIARGLASWGLIAGGKPIVPMAGEIDLDTPEEIAAYGAEMQRKGLTEGHFYADNANVPASIVTAIAAL